MLIAGHTKFNFLQNGLLGLVEYISLNQRQALVWQKVGNLPHNPQIVTKLLKQAVLK